MANPVCKQHNKPVYNYCCTCYRSLCSTCVGKHIQDHRNEPLIVDREEVIDQCSIKIKRLIHNFDLYKKMLNNTTYVFSEEEWELNSKQLGEFQEQFIVWVKEIFAELKAKMKDIMVKQVDKVQFDELKNQNDHYLLELEEIKNNLENGVEKSI